MRPVTVEIHLFSKATGIFIKKNTAGGVGQTVEKQRTFKRLNWISKWWVVKKNDSIKEKRFNPKIPNSDPVKRTTRHPWKVPTAICNPVSTIPIDDETIVPPGNLVEPDPPGFDETMH
jgi:hypothetical protein